MFTFFKRRPTRPVELHNPWKAEADSYKAKLDEYVRIYVNVKDGEEAYQSTLSVSEAMQALIEASNIEWVWDKKYAAGGYFKPKG